MTVRAGTVAMRPRTFCQSGAAEPMKGAVHVAAAVLLGVMAAYNGVAWAYRRERHLAFNAATYGVGTWFEVRQAERHLKRLYHPAKIISTQA